MKNSFIQLFQNQEKLSEKWVFLIIFLFPIAGPVVRHWNSLLFVLITFTALYFLFAKKDRKPLYKEEKTYLWVFFLFFAIYIVSVLVNGYSWEMIKKEGLGTEINYLLFVPIYLLIREYSFSQKALLAGILLSIPVIFIFSVYEYIYIMPTSERHNLNGAYFHLFIGPFTALSLLMAYPAYKEWIGKNKYYWAIPIYIAMGLFVITFSQARLGYLTIIGGTLILLFMLTKNIKIQLGGIVVIILIAVSAYQVDDVKHRMGKVIDDATIYLKTTKNRNNSAATSFGMRLEVWRSSKYTFQEHPLVGIGNGNYPNFIKKYINNGLVAEPVIIMGQAHNTYIEALITKGSIGLILVLMIFYYPMYIAWKNRNKSYSSFITITTFSTAITLISVGESMLINKNNGVAYLLFFSAVLFSSMIREQRSNT